jgi:serine protease Do
MRKRFKLVLIGLGVIVLSAASGSFGEYLMNRVSDNPVGSTLASNSSINLASQSSDLSIPALVNQVSPAIVTITTQSTTYSFFGGPQTEEGAGTGMILTSNGYILTNNHVVPQGSQSLTVLTTSQQQYSGRVVARNISKDLALVKIKASGLTSVKLGDSSDVTVGDNVIAIGNALGQFQNTVTNGIISGVNRAVDASDEGSGGSGESLSGLLQTDAAINPGNSGGPLIDSQTGEVIGMDTATSSDGQDLGFAIPIDEAKAFVAPYISRLAT